MSVRAVLALAIVLTALAGLVSAQEGRERLAVVGAIEGAIGPPAAHHVETILEAARERNAELVALRINTPGGLVTSTRDIISALTGSPIPVVSYVAPSGAHAASAGTYIVYATSVAAMAPGTNIGAATPVQMGGGGLPGLSPQEEEDSGEGEDGEGSEGQAPSGDAMTRKAVNDAVALIRSLAERYDRNAEWAEKAVREGASLSANAALDQNVVEIVTPSLGALLTELDGRTVKVGETTRTLSTQGIAVEHVEQGLVTELLAIITNPNVAFILMMIGVYGLIFELLNPGSLLPGVVGVIALILALYALNQLPLDYAGLALVGLGMAFMIGEVFTPTFGVLGIGGLIAFVIGAGMLIDTDIPAYQVSWSVIGVMAALTAGFLLFVLIYVVRAHSGRVHSGKETVLAAEARVVDWKDSEGHVWLQGERWQARGPEGLKPDQTVRVEAVDRLTLVVAAPEDTQTSREPSQKED